MKISVLTDYFSIFSRPIFVRFYGMMVITVALRLLVKAVKELSEVLTAPIGMPTVSSKCKSMIAG